MKKKMNRIGRFLSVFFVALFFVSLTTVNATQVRTGYYNRSYTLGNNQADNIVAVAQAQMGKTKAQLNYTEAWCADFVSDCASLAGISNIIPGNGYCQTLYNNIKNKGGQDVSSPQKGDIVFYYCKSCSVHWCHVGIMINSSQSVEGNYNGKVSLVNGIYKDGNGHSLANGHITRRFIRPAYASAKPFHINIDSPKAGASTTSGITAEGWAIYGNGVTNVTCNINGNTYNCSRKSRPDVAERNPGYPTGNEGFSYYIPEHLMHPGTNQLTFTAYNGNTVLGSSTRTFQYNMTASKTLSDGLYTIVSAVNNNSVFDIEWASMVDEGNLVISNRNGGNNQKFDVTYLGNGYYKIEAHHSKKALDVYNASTERLANVQQCGYHGGMNQKWILRSAGDGYYYIISANNGMYMDLPNADISPGNSIWMNWGNGSPAEKWKFESTTEKREEYNFTYINCDGSRTYVCGPGSTIRIRADQIKNGKRFKKFQVKSGNVKIDNEYSTSITVTMPESDLIIEAVYETIPTYKVTFNSNGGTVSGTSTKTVTSGEKYGTLPTATKSGYTFDGWYTSGSGGTRITENTTVSLTGNQTLYAHWTAKTYTITFNANGGNLSGNSYITVKTGSRYGTLPTAAKSGYTFDGWYTSGSGGTRITENTTVSLAGNQTLYAHWTAKTYTVTFNANGGNLSDNSYITVKTGSRYGTLPTATRNSYTFDGWYTSENGGTKITENTTVSLTGNQTLYAHWTAVKKYGVTIYNGTGNKTEMYPAGTSVRVKADSLENGMEFSKWVVLSGNIKLENESDIETSFTMPERSVVIQAVYEKSQADTDAGTDTDTDTGTDTDAGKDADTGKTDTPEADTEQDDEDESDLWTEFISGKIRYEVMDGKEAAVVGLKTKQVTKVKIPSTVSYDGRIYKVTEISDYAFKKSSVTEVVIADSVKEIGTSAFLGCKKLVKVTIGANTTKIGTKAFKDCSELKTIIVRSKKLKRIGKNAFSGIRKNAQIKVPAAQYKKYKKLFKGKGQGKKVVLKKYSGK